MNQQFQPAKYGAGEALIQSVMKATGVRGPFVYPNVDQLEGKAKKLDGECAKLIQVEMERLGNPVGLASAWLQGTRVRGNADSIARGTAIATFNKFGKYDNAAHGNHVAFYLEQDAKGIWVMEQYASAPSIQKRYLPFLDNRIAPPFANPSNNGNAFCVLLSTWPGRTS